MSTKIFAHRGASYIAPENTIPAFELAMEHGADGVELDVHLTKDGELVVIHDERVDRTTNGKGFVKDFTLDEIKALDASYGKEGYVNTRIPTLDEVYELFQYTDHVINVEIKTDIIDYPGICDKLLKLEDDMHMNGRIIYSSFNHYTVRELLDKRPDAKTGLLYLSIIHSPWNYAQRLGAACLHPHFITLSKTPQMVQNCIARNIETNVWTVDDPSWMRTLTDLGVTSIITNRPDYARTIVFGGR